MNNSSRTNTLKLFLWTFLFLVSFVGGFGLGIVTCRFILGKNETVVEQQKIFINRSTVVEQISEQGFLITRVVISDQEVSINVDEGSAWSNFWWGHKVDAKGKMQTDIGVDLTDIEIENVIVDNDNMTITIELPQAQIYNISLLDDISVGTKSGLLKKLFATDNEKDFNLALSQLEESTREAISADAELFVDARASVANILQTMFLDTEYEIIIK